MKRVLLVPFLVFCGTFLVSFAPQMSGQVQGPKVILVDVVVKSPRDVNEIHSEKFDKKRVELALEFDDPINTLDDFALGEEPLEGPGCFMPEMKLIFERYTYVFSLYCTSVIKYKNSAPYKPSGSKVKCDIQMTESVLQYLQDLRKQHFGEHFDPIVAKMFVKATKLDDVDIKVDDSDLYKDDNDDDDDDKEIENEAIDKEGWFDENKDPGLEEEEVPGGDDDDDDKKE